MWQIVIREEHRPLLDFLVSLCAIIGGIYTTASIIDGLIHGLNGVITKVNLGKQT